MFTSPPSQRLPAGAPHSTRQWMYRTNEQLASLSRFQGPGVSGGTLPTQVPQDIQFITGQIRIEGSGSGGSGSGQFSLDPVGAGFTDDDGYLAYAFDQTYDDRPWKGEVIVGGVSTTLQDGGVVGVNYAYPLNGETWEEGANVLLKRAGNHWIILGGTGDAAGSGSGGTTITCTDGTRYPVTISGNSITVGEPL